jgi:peptidoglycan hydrolase CwlO-like protein
MLRKLLPENYALTHPDLESEIFQSLKNIEQQLHDELAVKQKALEESRLEMRNLRAQLDAKDQVILALQGKVTENQRNIEGNRQLINKLLGDLDRMRQDVEWYKRTYESRSLLGTIKQKLFGK